jgi:uncharacterized membrane protein YphA (DoxX/SURF4 family)
MEKGSSTKNIQSKHLRDVEQKIEFGNTVITLFLGVQILTCGIFFYWNPQLPGSKQSVGAINLINSGNFQDSFRAVSYAIPAVALYSVGCIWYLFRRSNWTGARVFLLFHSLVTVLTILEFVYYLAELVENQNSSSVYCAQSNRWKWDENCNDYRTDAMLLSFVTGLMGLWGIATTFVAGMMVQWQSQKEKFRAVRRDLIISNRN